MPLSDSRFKEYWTAELTSKIMTSPLLFIRWSEFWNKNLSAQKNKSISPQILINHANFQTKIRKFKKKKKQKKWKKNKNHFIICRKRLGSVQFSAKHKKFFIYTEYKRAHKHTHIRTYSTPMYDQRSTKAPI